MSELKTTIPKGSLVLVTGVTGFIGSQIAKQFLERGYKVRGAVRNLDQAAWLVNDLFKTSADSGDFELTLVPDLAAPGAYDEAVKGVSAIAHLATIATFDSDPNKVVPQTVAGAQSILEAAIKEPSVREVVYTSSIVAETFQAPGIKTHVVQDTWNDAAVEAAWAPPPYEPSRGMATYSASKVEAEKAVWKFAEERKPHFTINAVNPSGVLGEPLHKTHVDSSIAYVSNVWKGNMAMLDPPPSAYFVDVKDVALLHIGAILDPEVKNQRLNAWANNTNWNEFLAILRKLRPDREFIEDFADPLKVEITADETESIAILKKWGRQDGWRSLEQGITDNISNPWFA